MAVWLYMVVMVTPSLFKAPGLISLATKAAGWGEMMINWQK
jgi:hypothetical protein